MDHANIYRAAVGRITELGEFYDATRDEFLCINAFKSTLTDQDISDIERNHSDINFIKIDSVEEEFKKLSIDGELGLSILCGLVGKLGGSSAFLDRCKSSAKSAHMTLTYSLRTKFQKVTELCSKVNVDILKSKQPTHIVVGIDWGANCNITCQYQRSKNEDEQDVMGKLEAEMEKLKLALKVNGNAKTDFTHSGQDCASKFSYHIECDVTDLQTDIPTTIEDVLAVAKSLPKAVLNINNGKGVPLGYQLLSLNFLREICHLEKDVDTACIRIKEDVAKRCIQVMNACRHSSQKVRDLVEEFNENNNAVSSDEFHTATELLNNVELNEAKFKSDLGRALIEARLGSENGQSKITSIIDTFVEGDFSPSQLNAIFGKFDTTMQKLKLVEMFKDNHVIYIGKGDSLEAEYQKLSSKHLYTYYLHFGEKYCAEKKEEWQANFDLFYRLMSAPRNDEEVQLMVIDCELLPKMTVIQGNCITYSTDGTICCTDLLQEERKDLDKCVIQVQVEEPLMQKPNNREPLEIRCPKSVCGSCSKNDHQWICRQCKETVEYGIHDQSLYCACGMSSIFYSKFRCSDLKHGLIFSQFDPNHLNQILPSLQSVKETNIVLLGATGVGKSTWINAIANYFMFSSLKDAINAEDINVCIPSRFSYTSEDAEAKEIFVGTEDKNEILEEGYSTTKEPKTYKFMNGNHTLSIIDTPGIGDIRGVEQDEKYIKSILAHLSYFDEIHGICIFLRSSSSMPITGLRYCIAELLTHFHKDAKNNIVFCFTNAGSTMYKSGNTLPILKAILKEYGVSAVGNQFFFDNEGFRFLACRKNGIQFSRGDIDRYSSSWDKAVNETMKFFRHIRSLKSHSMESTVSINNMKQFAIELWQTRFNISKTMETKKGDMKDGMSELNEAKRNVANTKKNMWIPLNLTYDAREKQSGILYWFYPQKQCTKENYLIEILDVVVKHFETNIKHLDYEEEVITNALIHFLSYLKLNAIVPFNEAVEKYLKCPTSQGYGRPYLFESESENLESEMESSPKMMITMNRQFMSVFVAMDENSSNDIETVSEPPDLETLKAALFLLGYNGDSLKKSFEKILNARFEYEHNEVTVLAREASSLKEGLWKAF